MKLHLDDINLIYNAFEQKEEDSLVNNNDISLHLNKSNKKRYDTGIDLSQLHYSSMSPIAPLSDVLLTIIEIGNNSGDYNDKYTNQTKVFWHEISQHKKIRRLLKGYTSMKLKRIWMTIKSIPQKKLIDFIVENSTMINDSHSNLVHIACIFSNLFQSDNTNHRNYPHYKDSKSLSKIFFEEINMFTIKRIKKKINNKESNQYDDINEYILQKTQILPTDYLEFNGNEYQYKNNNNQLELINPLYNSHKTFPFLTIESSRKEYNDLDDIVKILKDLFPQYSNMQIIHALHLNSCDIESTYISLKTNHANSNRNNDFNRSFTEAEDYIIKYMKATDLYTQLIIMKGEDSINRRQRYLHI